MQVEAETSVSREELCKKGEWIE